jgi:hypothetical protein
MEGMRDDNKAQPSLDDAALCRLRR